ncbi:helix-turn-helix domain-containing protein [Jiangella alkaliphila]|uniref:Transcriptional regulator, contains XRE-family HTH domain n=1 Tax=Jiangella alkaliphila TaxID=419479 RepID=A0A1H2I7P9_9ACTN|nr:helix-turn-helix transcriptional regulator [Jiangella alkaliphila]SDU39955.1 Transcriptional regulator, contains XRE-family HTH domain [Jiangella alkaliphila]
MTDHDPDSAAAFFGGELARARHRAGLTQEQLAEKLNYSRGAVANVETAQRPPQREFAERCDEILGTDGLLVRAWKMVSRESVPAKYRGFIEEEERAKSIHTYEQTFPPGLLQTQAYARELLAGVRMAYDNHVDTQVEARIRRQEILRRDDPPRLRAVIDEAALRRMIGGPDVMRDQLQHLLKMAEMRHITIQVMPFVAGAHAALNGQMTIFDRLNGQPVLYYEGPTGGHLMTDSGVVGDAVDRMDVLRAQALSPDESADLIRQVMEEL